MYHPMPSLCPQKALPLHRWLRHHNVITTLRSGSRGLRRTHPSALRILVPLLLTAMVACGGSDEDTSDDPITSGEAGTVALGDGSLNSYLYMRDVVVGDQACVVTFGITSGLAEVLVCNYDDEDVPTCTEAKGTTVNARQLGELADTIEQSPLMEAAYHFDQCPETSECATEFVVVASVGVIDDHGVVSQFNAEWHDGSLNESEFELLSDTTYDLIDDLFGLQPCR